MDKSVVDWTAVRDVYEAGELTLGEISVRFGVAKSTISRRVALDGWAARSARGMSARRLGAAARREPEASAALVRSLQRTTARLVKALEARLVGEDEVADEKDVRVLGALASALGKVIALASQEKPSRDDTGQIEPVADRPAPGGARASGGRDAAGGTEGRGDGSAGTGDLDFEDLDVLEALAGRLERHAARRAEGTAPPLEPERTAELSELLADVRAGRPDRAGG